MIEKFLFFKVPAWSLFAVALISALAAVGFGALAVDHIAGERRFGKAGAFAADIARAPQGVVLLASRAPPMMVKDPSRVPDGTGWTIDPSGPAATGYVLLSRFDGDTNRAVVELVDFATGTTQHAWQLDVGVLFADASKEDAAGLWQWQPQFFRAIHPTATRDGGLLIKGHGTPLVRIGPCGSIHWVQDEDEFHHSIEPDGQGNFWVPSHIRPNSFGPDANFTDDGLALVSPAGDIVFNRSLSRIFMDNGLTSLLFSIPGDGYDSDPLHLNDIQPVPGNGPFWKEGDLFLSLRSPSLVALYRPSTNKILWYRQGPWLSQHDVDVVDDRTIAVFSNNTYSIGEGSVVDGSNEVIFFEFGTEKMTHPFQAAMVKEKIATDEEGLWDLTPDGFAMIEDNRAGRLLVLRPDGSVYADYVNRASDGNVYYMAWSRFLDQESGDALARMLAGLDCGASAL